MNHIVEYRMKLGITQLELAIKAGLHPSGLSRLEKGVRCNRDTADRIAEVLNESPETVFPDYNSFRAGVAK